MSDYQVAVAIEQAGERNEAAVITLAIAVEKLAKAQLETAKAEQQKANAIQDIANIYHRRF